MHNCGACGRFMNRQTDGATCSRCPVSYHFQCLGRAKAAAKLPNWLCPECSKNKPRNNRSETPAKGVPDADSGDDNASVLSPRHSNTSEVYAATDIGHADLAKEIRLFREQMANIQEQIMLMRQDFQDLRTTLAGNTSRIEILEGKVETLERDISAKASTGSDMEGIIDELKSQLNDRDQELLANDIEISNIPETSGENPIHIMSLIAAKLGVPVDERDIVSAERVGVRQQRGAVTSVPAARPRPLVVRLTRRTTRDDLLKSMRVRRGANTADFGLSAESRPFYLNERLTKFNRMLLYKARQARARLHWNYVWTRRGRIYVKQAEGKPTFCIGTELDLSRVFGD